MKDKILLLSHTLILASCLALILIYSINEFFLSPAVNITFWLIKVLPLAAMMPSLMNKNLRSLQWLCFLIMIYFIQGVLDIFSPDNKILGLLEAFITLLIFCSAIFFVHGYQKINNNQTSIQE